MDLQSQVMVDPLAEDPHLDMIGRAIERARMDGREGPFGLFDYSGYGDPVPYHVRDFRDTSSGRHGRCIHRSTDRDEAQRVYDAVTREHVAKAAIAAVLTAFGLSPLRHEAAEATEDQRREARKGGLAAMGDMQLLWVNTGDLHQHEMIPCPKDMGIMGDMERRGY